MRDKVQGKDAANRTHREVRAQRCGQTNPGVGRYDAGESPGGRQHHKKIGTKERKESATKMPRRKGNGDAGRHLGNDTMTIVEVQREGRNNGEDQS